MILWLNHVLDAKWCHEKDSQTPFSRFAVIERSFCKRPFNVICRIGHGLPVFRGDPDRGQFSVGRYRADDGVLHERLTRSARITAIVRPSGAASLRCSSSGGSEGGSGYRCVPRAGRK